MEIEKGRGGFLFQVTFCAAALMICLLAVFPEQYYLLNIGIVILLCYDYLISNRLKTSLGAVLVALFMVAQIALTRDVARVSIFVFCLLLYTDALYEPRAVKWYIRIAFVCLLAVLIAYALLDFNSQYDRLSWDFVEQLFFEEKALGFQNPNRCMLHVFCLSSLILLNTGKLWHYICVFLVNCLYYYFTRSRTFFYVMVMIVACLFLFRLFKQEDRCTFLGRCVPGAFLLLTALSIILPMFFSDTILNEIFTRRLVHNKTFLDTGITLLGNSALESATFDSSYLHMLLTKGVLFFGVYTLLLIGRCRRARITNKQAVVLVAVFLACFMEVIFLEYSVMYLLGFLLAGGDQEAKRDAQ